jgi:hypothetical protein
MTALIQNYNQGNTTVLPSFQRNVRYLVKTKEHPNGEQFLLEELYKLCQQKSKRMLYVFIQHGHFVDTIDTLDGVSLWEHRCFRDLHAQIVIENDEILLVLNEHGTNRITAFEIVKKLVSTISGGIITVVDLNQDSSTDGLIKDQSLPEMPDSTIRIIELPSAQHKRVFRQTGSPWKYQKSAHINTSHSQIKKILDQIEQIKIDSYKKAIYESYFYLLAGKFDKAVALLEKVLTNSL